MNFFLLTLGNTCNLSVSLNNFEALPPIHFLPAELAVLLFYTSLKNLFSQFIDNVHFLLGSAFQLYYLLPFCKKKLFVTSLFLVIKRQMTVLNLAYLLG